MGSTAPIRLSPKQLDSMEEVLDAVLDHPTTGHATVASLRAAGGFLPLRVPAVAYADRKFESSSTKIEFYSSQAERLRLTWISKVAGQYCALPAMAAPGGSGSLF